MAKVNRVRRKQKAPAGSTRSKGDFVEEVVAAMHESEGVVVTKNAFLATSDSAGSREIDVLLKSDVAGYPVYLAIECKNVAKVVGIKEIDVFVGKLQDVGIPLQHGIFVSASGYTKGAVRRAHKVGIKPLVLKDLTEQMPGAIQHAFQSIIYLLAEASRFRIQNNIPHIEQPAELTQFRDPEGNLVGSVADLIWDAWQAGRIPRRIGTHDIDLIPEPGWVQIIGGKTVEVYSAGATVKVIGYAITITGTVRHMSLMDVAEKQIAREQLKAEFERPSGKLPIRAFQSEQELEQYLNQEGSVRITVGRINIPRIVWQGIYWPPSKRTMQKIASLWADFESGRIPDPRPFRISEIEGDDLSAAWESPWEENPFLKGRKNKQK